MTTVLNHQANGLNQLANSTNNHQPKPRGRRKKIRTEPVRPICPQCEKQFSNQSALTKHKLTHSDERKFACQQCSKAFKRHDHLTGHMQTHSNRKPFNCTIQGCDKTYCDARSLRRHKENIHHIVTPKETNNNNQTNSGLNGGDQGQSQHQLVGSSIKQSGSAQQVFKHEQIAANHNGSFLDISSSSGQLLDSSSATTIQPQHAVSFTSVDSASCIQPDSEPRWTSLDHNNNDNNNNLHHHNNHHHHHHHQNHYQASYSADYASTQHFSFDFNHNLIPNHQMDQQVSGDSIPLSADSVMASESGSTQHQQGDSSGYATTPTSASGSLTQSNQQFNTSTATSTNQPQQTQPQQATTAYQQPVGTVVQLAPSFDHTNDPNVHQPSHLLRRRIQRFHSDSGVYPTASATDIYQTARLEPLRCPIDQPNLHYQQQLQPPNQHHHHQQQQHHHHPHASFSAGCASNQHFTFVDNGSAPPSGQIIESPMQQQHQNHYQAPYSADCASTQHFSFDFNHNLIPNHQMDQQVSSNSIPLSADSVIASESGSTQHQQLDSSGYATTPTSASGSLTQSNQQFNTSTATSTNQPQQTQPQQATTAYQQPVGTVQLAPSFDHTNDPNMHQPSHLLRRRIQRFHSDSGVYPTASATDIDQTARLEPLRCPIDQPNLHYQQQLQPPNQHHHHQQQQHHHHPHASFIPY